MANKSQVDKAILDLMQAHTKLELRAIKDGSVPKDEALQIVAKIEQSLAVLRATINHAKRILEDGAEGL